MPDYSQGKIYKLVNKVDDEIFIGSTIQSLPMILSSNKVNSASKPNQRVYKHISDIGGWLKVKIILIEEYSCKNKMQLDKKQREWIDKLHPSLNKSIPVRTMNEASQYYRDHNTNYRELHKEAIKEKRSQPYTCSICNCEFTLQHKYKHEKIENI